MYIFTCASLSFLVQHITCAPLPFLVHHSYASYIKPLYCIVLLTSIYRELFIILKTCKGLQFLNQLEKKHGNFTLNFKFGISIRTFMLGLLCSVLMDMNHSFLNTISEAQLLEWRGVVKELMKASLTWV
jgi:hypothetical protein